MQATIETMALIRQADEATMAANKSGVKAVMALIRENVGERFVHGSAVELANILKDGKVSSHSAKRYADICVMACKAITHKSNLATNKVKADEKSIARIASIEDNLATLAGMVSMSKIREWSKEHGPKGTAEKTSEKASDKAPTPAPTPEPTPEPATIEAVGQLREIRECLAMVNLGQLTQVEALSAIAEIVGLAITTPAKTAKTAKTAKLVKTGT